MDTGAYQRGSAVLKDEGPDTTRAEFHKLYREHHVAVRRHLLYLTGDPELAEDLTQETFSKLYQRGTDSPSGADIRNPAAWLFTVASNLAYNYFRSEGRRTARESSSGPTEVRELDSTLEIRSALQSLDARDRVVLMLRAAGFSYAEIADAVGVAPASVGTVLARAQRRFREAYEGATRPTEKE